METLPLDELWRETRTNMSHRDEEEWDVCLRLVMEEEELQTAVKKRCLKTVERYMEMGYAFAFDPGSSLVLASKKRTRDSGGAPRRLPLPQLRRARAEGSMQSRAAQKCSDAP